MDNSIVSNVELDIDLIDSDHNDIFDNELSLFISNHLLPAIKRCVHEVNHHDLVTLSHLNIDLSDIPLVLHNGKFKEASIHEYISLLEENIKKNFYALKNDSPVHTNFSKLLELYLLNGYTNDIFLISSDISNLIIDFSENDRSEFIKFVRKHLHNVSFRRRLVYQLDKKALDLILISTIKDYKEIKTIFFQKNYKTKEIHVYNKLMDQVYQSSDFKDDTTDLIKIDITVESNKKELLENAFLLDEIIVAYFTTLSLRENFLVMLNDIIEHLSPNLVSVSTSSKIDFLLLKVLESDKNSFIIEKLTYDNRLLNNFVENVSSSLLFNFFEKYFLHKKVSMSISAIYPKIIEVISVYRDNDNYISIIDRYLINRIIFEIISNNGNAFDLISSILIIADKFRDKYVNNNQYDSKKDVEILNINYMSKKASLVKDFKLRPADVSEYIKQSYTTLNRIDIYNIESDSIYNDICHFIDTGYINNSILSSKSFVLDFITFLKENRRADYLYLLNISVKSTSSFERWIQMVESNNSLYMLRNVSSANFETHNLSQFSNDLFELRNMGKNLVSDLSSLMINEDKSSVNVLDVLRRRVPLIHKNIVSAEEDIDSKQIISLVSQIIINSDNEILPEQELSFDLHYNTLSYFMQYNSLPWWSHYKDVKDFQLNFNLLFIRDRDKYIQRLREDKSLKPLVLNNLNLIDQQNLVMDVLLYNNRFIQLVLDKFIDFSVHVLSDFGYDSSYLNTLSLRKRLINILNIVGKSCFRLYTLSDVNEILDSFIYLIFSEKERLRENIWQPIKSGHALLNKKEEYDVLFEKIDTQLSNTLFIDKIKPLDALNKRKDIYDAITNDVFSNFNLITGGIIDNKNEKKISSFFRSLMHINMISLSEYDMDVFLDSDKNISSDNITRKNFNKHINLDESIFLSLYYLSLYAERDVSDLLLQQIREKRFSSEVFASILFDLGSQDINQYKNKIELIQFQYIIDKVLIPDSDYSIPILHSFFPKQNFHLDKKSLISLLEKISFETGIENRELMSKIQNKFLELDLQNKFSYLYSLIIDIKNKLEDIDSSIDYEGARFTDAQLDYLVEDYVVKDKSAYNNISLSNNQRLLLAKILSIEDLELLCSLFEFPQKYNTFSGSDIIQKHLDLLRNMLGYYDQTKAKANLSTEDGKSISSVLSLLQKEYLTSIINVFNNVEFNSSEMIDDLKVMNDNKIYRANLFRDYYAINIDSDNFDFDIFYSHFILHDDIKNNSVLNVNQANDNVIRMMPAKKINLNDQIKIEPIFIQNAGLIIVWPFLRRFFNNLGFLNNGTFVDKDSQEKAIHLLHYLVYEKSYPEEFMLPLNKLICNFPFNEPVGKNIELSDNDISEVNILLESLKKSWKSVKNSTFDAIRETFLMRDGIIEFRNNKCVIHIEKKAVDVLLSTIPWSLSVIKLPWLDFHITIEWNKKN